MSILLSIFFEQTNQDLPSTWQETILTGNTKFRKLSSEESQKLQVYLENLETNYCSTVEEISNSKELEELVFMLQAFKTYLKEKSRTAKSWVSYLDYIQVTKDFIRAERTGNWSLHLKSVRNMLNLFAATGHFHYAKCASVYYQQMMELEKPFPFIY